MVIEKQRLLSISFINEEVDDVLDLLEKIKELIEKDIKKVGFKKQFEDKELKLVNNILNEILEDEPE